MRFCFVPLFGCLMFFLSGCSTEENILETQRTAFETYLNGQGKAYEIQDGVYRYIDNIGREGRGEEPQITLGDKIRIDFSLYSFGSSGLSQLYYTSIPEQQKELGDFNTEFWPQLPATFELGTDPLMKGLERGLAGCRQNDEVELYLTYDLGFGGEPLGMVPQETPLVWQIRIHEVIKQ